MWAMANTVIQSLRSGHAQAWRAFVLGGGLCVGLGSFVSAQDPSPTNPTPLAAGPSVAPFNLHLVATEAWLNLYVGRTDQTTGIVDDVILGAKVDGQQLTTSQLQLDLRPSADQIAATFRLEGQTGTSTRGTTEQAVVFTRSQQAFSAVKDCFFDGNVFSTRHAVVKARAQNQNMGVSTRFDGTALQPFVTPFVLKSAEQRRPEAETIARNRVVDRIYPEFDQRIDRELSGLNDRLETSVRKRLRELNLMPGSQQCRSTVQELHYAARFSAENRDFEIVSPSRPLLSNEGVRLYVHNSLFEAAALRGGLAGLKTTDRQLDHLLRRAGLATEGADPIRSVETQIEFDDHRPLSVVFEDDEFELQLRLKLRPAGQNLLPPLTIAIPFRLVESDGERLLRPGQLRLRSRAEDGLESPLAPAMETLIRQAVSENLRDVPLPRTLGDTASLNGKTPPQLKTIRFREGWLAVGID